MARNKRAYSAVVPVHLHSAPGHEGQEQAISDDVIRVCETHIRSQSSPMLIAEDEELQLG